MSQEKDNNNQDFAKAISSNLNKFFIKDIYVALTSYKLLTPLNAVVLDYASNILVVRFKSKDLQRELLVGDPVVINLVNKDVVYNVSASVLVCTSTTMDLKIEKVVKKEDLRKERRFLVGFSGELLHDNNKTFIVIKNIGLQGLNFLCKEDIEVGSEINVSINTYDYIKIDVKAKIVHKTSLIDNYSYGVFITDITEDNKVKLIKCLKSLE